MRLHPRAKKLAASDKTLLITGGPGTGKSKLSKTLHGFSNRSSEKFIHVNLCNFSSGVFESELFGHSRGSFTGAHLEKKGFVEAVGKGTLFLDEVGDLGLDTQAKLLMLLEEGLYYPVGSTECRKFKGRLIFATNKNLPEMVKKGEFRADLYHRLRTYEIRLENLGGREDIENVIEDLFFIAKEEGCAPNALLGAETLEFLKTYSWPGNFRELKNILEYSLLMTDGVINIDHLPPYLLEMREGRIRERRKPLEAINDYHEALEEFEKAYLTKMLKQRGFRINYTSREINISKVTLLSKIKKYDIKKEANNLICEKAM